MQFEITYTCIDMTIGYEFKDPWNWDFYQNNGGLLYWTYKTLEL